MKRSMCSSVLCCGMLGAWLLATAPVSAQQPPQPTPQHKELAKDEGVWDAEVSMWMAPEEEPMKSKAVETNKMLGKMWLISKFEGEFLGQKFNGVSQLGYDPLKKKFVGTWIDSMSPYLMTMEGDYDEKTKTATMTGNGIDFETGKECKMKMVTRYENDDTKVFEMYALKDGKEEKTMEAKYTRRK